MDRRSGAAQGAEDHDMLDPSLTRSRSHALAFVARPRMQSRGVVRHRAQDATAPSPLRSSHDGAAMTPIGASASRRATVNPVRDGRVPITTAWSAENFSVARTTEGDGINLLAARSDPTPRVRADVFHSRERHMGVAGRRGSNRAGESASHDAPPRFGDIRERCWLRGEQGGAL